MWHYGTFADRSPAAPPVTREVGPTLTTSTTDLEDG